MRRFALSTLGLLGLAAGLTVAHPSASRADMIKLDLLLRSCTGKSPVTLADCSGYIGGIADELEDQNAICMPDRVELKSVRETVVAYVQSHHPPPETKAASAVSDALRASYPCKKP